MDYAMAASRIRETRKHMGLTQAQLAEKSGVSAMSIRRYESAERKANLDVFTKIAKALEVDPNWLMYGAQPVVTTQAQNEQMQRFMEGLRPTLLGRWNLALENFTIEKSEFISYMKSLNFECSVDSDEGAIVTDVVDGTDYKYTVEDMRFLEARIRDYIRHEITGKYESDSD